MKACGKPRGGCRRSRRLIESIQKLNCTLPHCKETVDHRQNMEEDDNPYFFPVVFPEMSEQDVNTLQETFNSSTSCTPPEEPISPTQHYHDSLHARTLNEICLSSVESNTGAKKEYAVATTAYVAPSICSWTHLKGEPQPLLSFDDERYTYSPEPEHPLDEEPSHGAAMKPRLNFDDDLCGCDGDVPDPPIGRIRTDESSGVPLVIQFAIGECEGSAEIAQNFCHGQDFSSTHHGSSEDTLSMRTPVGHYQEEDNDSSRDQPSLTSMHSRRSRQSRIQHQRRIASYASQDCETYTTFECSPSISRPINSITHSNNFHFEIDESPARCFRMKCSPGESKPSRQVLFDARHRKTLSDKLGQVQKPVSVRGASLSNITTRSGATEVTVATTLSTSSIGSRASSSGMRVLHLISPYDRQTLDRSLNDSASTITPLPISPVLGEDINFEMEDNWQAPPKSSIQDGVYMQFPEAGCRDTAESRLGNGVYGHFAEEASRHTEKSIGMVDTTFDTYYSGITEDHYYHYEG